MNLLLLVWKTNSWHDLIKEFYARSMIEFNYLISHSLLCPSFRYLRSLNVVINYELSHILFYVRHYLTSSLSHFVISLRYLTASIESFGIEFDWFDTLFLCYDRTMYRDLSSFLYYSFHNGLVLLYESFIVGMKNQP